MIFNEDSIICHSISKRESNDTIDIDKKINQILKDVPCENKDISRY